MNGGESSRSQQHTAPSDEFTSITIKMFCIPKRSEWGFCLTADRTRSVNIAGFSSSCVSVVCIVTFRRRVQTSPQIMSKVIRTPFQCFTVRFFIIKIHQPPNSPGLILHFCNDPSNVGAVRGSSDTNGNWIAPWCFLFLLTSSPLLSSSFPLTFTWPFSLAARQPFNQSDYLTSRRWNIYALWPQPGI